MSFMGLILVRLLKNPDRLSFRGAADGEESRTAFGFRAGFLPFAEFTLSEAEGPGVTAFRNVFQQRHEKRYWNCFIDSTIQ
jgi:hypothetical protein